jgi:hypothetical protein
MFTRVIPRVIIDGEVKEWEDLTVPVDVEEITIRRVTQGRAVIDGRRRLVVLCIATDSTVWVDRG